MTFTSGQGPSKTSGHYRQTSTTDLYPAGTLDCAIGALTTFTAAANTLYAVPFLSTRPGTMDRMVYEVTTGAGNTRVGVYTNSATSNAPASRVIDTGSVSTAATGVQTISTNLPLNLMGDTLYWFCLVSDSTPAFRAIAAGNSWGIFGLASTMGAVTPKNAFTVAFTYAALPASFPGGGTEVSQALPLICARYSA